MYLPGCRKNRGICIFKVQAERPGIWLAMVQVLPSRSRRKNRRRLSPGLPRKINESPTRGYVLGNRNTKLDLFRHTLRKNKKKDSISLFSRKPATEKSNKPKKEKAVKPEKLDLSFKTASMITQAYLKTSRGL